MGIEIEVTASDQWKNQENFINPAKGKNGEKKNRNVGEKTLVKVKKKKIQKHQGLQKTANQTQLFKNEEYQDFPGGAMDGNPRAWVQSLVREDSTCRRATKPTYHDCWGCSLEPVRLNKRSRCGAKPEHLNEE